MRTSWSKSNGRGERYIRVDTHSVIVGEHHGSGHTDNAGTCSHEAFLAGQFHDLIRRDHSPGTLAEVIAAVEQAPSDTTFKKALSREAKLVRAWRKIPEDVSFGAMTSHPDDRGMLRYDGDHPIGIWHAELFYEAYRQSIRVTDRTGAVVFEVDDGDNPLSLGNNIRVADVIRCGDVVLFRCDNYFLQDAPAVMGVVGRRSWLQVNASGIVARWRQR